MTEILGYGSSAMLFVTVMAQIRKQWRLGTNEGVSKWLFAGQLAASIGFLIYSLLTGSTVFAVTNAVLAVSNFLGIAIYIKNRE